MAETTSNIEFAHKIHESGHHGGGSLSHGQEWLEILEAVVLAAVAVLTPGAATRPRSGTPRARPRTRRRRP